MENETVWAVTPQHYETLASNYQTFTNSPELQKEAVAFNRETGEVNLNISDGVAIVDISGTVRNNSSFFSWLYGGAVIPAIRAQLDAAAKDYQVKSVLLNVNSPGGTVPGVDDLSRYIRGYDKPVIAYTGGMMASAAMWIGSAADNIVVSKTAEVGSIGVLAVHRDMTKMAEDMGVKFTLIRAGEYKAIGNPYEPLKGKKKEELQAQVDYLYSIFVDRIAENRGVSVEQALEMADGRIFIGQQAVDFRLADHIGSYDEAVSMARDVGSSAVKYFLMSGKSPGKETDMADIKSVKELEAAFPDIVAQIRSDAIASVDNTEDVQVEAARVIGLAEIRFGDEEGKFKALVESGVTVAQLAAIKDNGFGAPVVQEPTGESDEKKAMLGALADVTAEDPGQGATAQDEGPKTFEAAWKGIKKAEGCTVSEAMAKASVDFPDLYEKQRKGA